MHAPIIVWDGADSNPRPAFVPEVGGALPISGDPTRELIGGFSVRVDGRSSVYLGPIPGETVIQVKRRVNAALGKFGDDPLQHIEDWELRLNGHHGVELVNYQRADAVIQVGSILRLKPPPGAQPFEYEYTWYAKTLCG